MNPDAKKDMKFDEDIIQPSRKSTEPSRLIQSDNLNQVNYISLQEQPFSPKVGDEDAPEEEVEEEEINQKPSIKIPHQPAKV